MQLTSGILIAIEGIDGSGKSTLAKNLYQELHNQNIPVVLTKEPGGSQLGRQLRTILQTQTVPLCPQAEYLLFAADRAQHFTEVIIPNLRASKIVISDRMADSSLVYQGHGRGLDLELIRTVNAFAMQAIQPDLVLYLRISPEQAMERLRKRNKELTAFEQEQASFSKKLVEGFDAIFKERKNVIYLDGTQAPEQLTNQAMDALLPWIKKHTAQ